MHEAFLTEIALVAVVALSCGILFERIKQPAVLGYILAGVLLGPSVLNSVQDRAVIETLAELGVQMLLFLVGMELSLRAFKTVWRITLICMLLQVSASLAVVLGLGTLFDWPFGLSVLLAFAIALSSTAVAIKMLESIGELRTETGRITIGILIAQDLAIVPMILILKSMNGESMIAVIFLKVAISVALLVLFIWFFSRKQKIQFHFLKRATLNEDLTPIVALVFCFGVAFFTGVLGLSAVFGAFLGGLILGNTTERHTMVEATKPIQSVLLMVFFLSVGLLMDFGYIWDHLGRVLILLLFITVGKTFFNIFILHLLKEPWPRAFLSGLMLAQMGEFSFVLASIGISSGLIDEEGQRLVISLAALSLAISPLWMSVARRLHNLAPTGLENFHQIIELLYGRRIEKLQQMITRLKEVTQTIIEKKDVEESPESKAPETENKEKTLSEGKEVDPREEESEKPDIKGSAQKKESET
ncbi:MAG: cation:proton antiporter [bacterium]|nr:cation:proton antiporter [bacterium]